VISQCHENPLRQRPVAARWRFLETRQPTVGPVTSPPKLELCHRTKARTTVTNGERSDDGPSRSGAVANRAVANDSVDIHSRNPGKAAGNLGIQSLRGVSKDQVNG